MAESDIPSFITAIQDKLQTVRKKIGGLEQQLWPQFSGRRSVVERITEPEPILRVRIELALEPLRLEEDRLMAELRAAALILPPIPTPDNPQ